MADPFFQDLFDLTALVVPEDESLVADSGVDFGRELVGEVGGVGDRYYDQLALPLLRPLEDIVEHLLVPGLEVVDLVQDDYPR